MKNPLLLSLVVPFIFGLISFILPNKNKKLASILALIVSFITFCLCIAVFVSRPFTIELNSLSYFLVDNLSAFITLFIGLFGFLIVLYSLDFMKDKENINQYYAYVLWTISASIGVAVSNHLLLFLTFWGVLGITLYLLIAMGGNGADSSAKKAFVIIGGSDTFLLLGIAIVWRLTSNLFMNQLNIELNNNLAFFSFLCLALGAFAKAGAIPLHTWIPACAESAPTPVMAFLPASLDKLLGIYFVFRISVDMFRLKPNSAMSLFLMIVGAITIIAAVMMALIQHNLKKLLSYHAVSQVGYMLLGIGTASPIGIAGGLFHMLNHAIYKSCLFLCAGNVEKKLNTTDLAKLGGLAKVMPITFITFIIASLSISGIPPFNGFVSKWMIYQGIIELGKTGTKLWPIWLVAAMFGSALTLASFMKLIHAVFLGQPATQNNNIKESALGMKTVVVILASLCVIFGIFALQLPIKLFIAPSLNREIGFMGIWNPTLATLLILIGIVIGIFIYLLGTLKFREVEQFIGGEDLKVHKQMRASGVEFYNTIKEIGFLNNIYKKAEQNFFEIYEQGKKFIFSVSSLFQNLHNGILPTYLVWCLLGTLGLFYFFMFR